MAVVNSAAVNTGELMSTGAFALALGYIQQRWSCWVTWSQWSRLQQMRVLILPRSADTNFLLSLVATLATGPESLKLGELCWTRGGHICTYPLVTFRDRRCNLWSHPPASLLSPSPYLLRHLSPQTTALFPAHLPPALRWNGTSVLPTQGCCSRVPAACVLPALPGPGVMAPPAHTPVKSPSPPFWPVHGMCLVSAGILEPPQVEQAP